MPFQEVEINPFKAVREVFDVSIMIDSEVIRVHVGPLRKVQETYSCPIDFHRSLNDGYVKAKEIIIDEVVLRHISLIFIINY